MRPPRSARRAAQEFERLKAELGAFAFSATKPYWSAREKKAAGTGGLFSITVNPLTCKACALCVDVCDDKALKMVTQTEGSVAELNKDWGWLARPADDEQGLQPHRQPRREDRRARNPGCSTRPTTTR